VTALRTQPVDGRVRVGVIGAGSIAQMIHLPYLRDLSDRFAIAALCDIAGDTLDAVGDLYGVSPEARFVDYRDLCASDEVDAVVVCPNGSHVPQAIAALEHGKHVLVEKPLCYTKQEADAFVEAARAAKRRSGAVTLLAYMKRFDPGYQYGQRLVRPLADAGRLRFVDARHIHTRNEHYMAHMPVFRGTDIAPGVVERLDREHEADVETALGKDASPTLRQVFRGMMGSSVHDVYSLNGLLGRPEEIVASETWDNGLCWSAIFRYPNGVRVNYAWIDIRDVRAFHEEFACYGDDTRVTITFGQPFLTSAATTVRVQSMEPSPSPRPPHGRAPDDLGWDDPGPAHAEKIVIPSYVNQYKREWLHFHACITQGVEPLVGPEEARDDAAFIVDWARATRAL
jgi:predicted dehydrogenase